jgi:hypothetical protein
MKIRIHKRPFAGITSKISIWRIKLEIFGWVRETQVCAFTMEKHLLNFRNNHKLVYETKMPRSWVNHSVDQFALCTYWLFYRCNKSHRMCRRERGELVLIAEATGA